MMLAFARKADGKTIFVNPHQVARVTPNTDSSSYIHDSEGVVAVKGSASVVAEQIGNAQNVISQRLSNLVTMAAWCDENFQLLATMVNK